MKIFHCDHCGHLLFFENSLCVNCGHALAYIPAQQDIASLEAAGDNLWRPVNSASSESFRLCSNYDSGICNWAVPADDPEPLCKSCRTTLMIPDLSIAGHKEAWFQLETAKRRLFYSLMSLGLEIRSRDEEPASGLGFQFLAADTPGAPPVTTGHDDGLITINLAEADDAQREQTRLSLGEPYRTVLGHFRHEIGHYFWDRLVKDSPHIDAFRELFGDERQDYAAALKQHYDEGVANWQAPNWQQNFVSAYASSHPWEDWAETWAHYLHMVDALETAKACGLSLTPTREDEPHLDAEDHGPRSGAHIEKMVQDWVALTYVLNNLNRSLGLSDAYPFVLTTVVISKLAFVHALIAEAAAQPDADDSPPLEGKPEEVPAVARA
ncbi:putative zinc-binding peptidase [Uliginosibacterium sp. H3]|uniref:Zinc-binding peptidase n=1 Tax=Uliginosibacterium silvisoli TaxID=3114758 RepID=A0ABU6K856_9RHOO|nr:putative zinc-binding peptidase [Uliginosibacterium sp. H3]